MNSGDPSANDQSQKEQSISLAASSMINASDKITAETYHDNAKRIQAVKEMAWRLELNNEAAHRNFLLDQLEKRAKAGREAESMLTQLRNQPGLPATVQCTNNAAIDKSEVILPTTATLVEVPDSNPSPPYPSPTISNANTSTHLPQNVQQRYPVTHQQTAPQVQPRYSGVFPYHMTPPAASPSLHHNVTPYIQAPVNTTQTGWYATQNQPSQPMVYNPSVQTSSQPTRTQPPLRSWSNYPPQGNVPPAAGSTFGYHIVPGGWIGRAPAYFPPSTSSTNMTYGEAGISVRSNMSRPPVTTHNQSSDFVSRVQVPSQGVPSALVKSSVAQPPIRSYSTPAESQSQLGSTVVPKPIVVSESQQPQKLPERSQATQPRQLPTPQSQPQPKPQRPPQSSQKSQDSQQSHTRHMSHQPPQPQQTPLPPVDLVPSTSAPLSHDQLQRVRDSLPVDPSHWISQTRLQEQGRQGGMQQHQIDQAMFIKLFQNAVQRGTSQLQTFWVKARASGITEEWFKAAINSLPRGVWEAVIAQSNQSGHRSNAHSQSTQQQVLANPSQNVPIACAPPPSGANSAVKTTSTAQQAAERGVPAEGDAAHSIPRQISGPYTTELQYYADQATKSAFPSQTASVSTSLPRSITPIQIMTATPKRDAPQIKANMRTPKDANKSTLARDVLRALGKTVQSHQETGGALANNIRVDELTGVNPSRTDSRTSTKPPPASLEACFVDANSSPISSANPNVQNVPQRIVPQCQPIMKSVLKEESGQPNPIEGPIMIDLTLEDSDESIDGKGQEPFLMQASTSPAVSPQPVSPILTTNHTPLLESLSLNEPTASTKGINDDADVRMGSPPSGLVVEENTGSERFYSPLGSAEPVSQSFELLSNEAREHHVDGQLPLFLPSPPVSPVHTEPPITDSEMVHDEDESGLAQKRRSIDVDKVEIEVGTTPPRVRKRRRQQVYVLIPPAPLYVKKAKMKARAVKGRDSSFEGVEQDEEISYDHLEQLLIEESKSRLFERRCRWLNCTAILNCAANLLIHLRNHVLEEASEAPFFCRWTTCQRQFGMEQERDTHLERHAIRPLPCPRAGCDKQFDKPIEVMLHEVQHQGEPVRQRPTCLPTVPAIPARLGTPPHWLPSHRVIPRRVAKCQISADRHATVGPWVLWNIFSPVELSVRKQNTSMRGRPTRPVIVDDKDSCDDYDFLLALSPCSSAKETPLDDLDSTLVTMSAARGLTLWGSGVPDEVARTSVVREEEEEDVERMLTVY